MGAGFPDGSAMRHRTAILLLLLRGMGNTCNVPTPMDCFGGGGFRLVLGAMAILMLAPPWIACNCCTNILPDEE